MQWLLNQEAPAFRHEVRHAVCADEKAVLDSIVDGVTSKAFDVNVKGDVRKALKEFPFREWSGRLHYAFITEEVLYHG